jgi:hypothetical protein
MVGSMLTVIKEKPISVPTNVDDSTTLKRFLTDLVAKLNINPLVTYPITYGVNNPVVPTEVLNVLGAYTSNLLDAAVKANAITEEAKTYITKTLTTQVLANEESLAAIIQQFGTFKDLTTAAAWYGLTVKSGELISGFTVSGVDTDTTTPGTAGSTFAISADNFSVAKAISDITNPSELAYVQAHNLPYGTMYDANTSKIIPAFLIQWNGASYDIIFNGKVSFTNVSGSLDTSRITNTAGWTDDTVANTKLPSNSDLAAIINANTTTIDGGKITALSILAAAIAANTITGNKLAANTITANNIAALTITANELATGAITAAKVAANAITADKISVSTLSAICADIGTITAGTINAAVINAGILNIAQIPAMSYQEVENTNTNSTSFTSTGSYYVVNAVSGESSAPYNYITNRIRKYTLTFSCTLSTTTSVTGVLVWITVNGNGGTSSAAMTINLTSSAVAYTFNVVVYDTPTSDTDFRGTVVLKHNSSYSVTCAGVSGTLMTEQSYK